MWLLTLFSHVPPTYTCTDQHVFVMLICEQQAATSSLSVKPCYYVFLACTTPFFLMYVYELARLLTKRAQTVKQRWLTWFRHKKNYCKQLLHLPATHSSNESVTVEYRPDVYKMACHSQNIVIQETIIFMNGLVEWKWIEHQITEIKAFLTRKFHVDVQSVKVTMMEW